MTRFRSTRSWGLSALALAALACEVTHVEHRRMELECAPSDYAHRDAAELFGVEGVPRFELVMEETTYEAHQRRALDEEYTPVTACYEGKRIGTIAMRFKGQVGSLERCFRNGQLACGKLSMRLKFDAYDESLRFFGLKRLNLHSMTGDPSAVRERLAYDLYREMGVEAPRSAWAEVVVDGWSRGLFSMVEQIDGRFTDSRWPDDGDGDLYKEAWPVSTDVEFYREHLENNEETAKPELLVDFATRLAETPPEQRLEFLAERLDVDHWLRYLAVDDAIANWDGATTFYVDKGGRNHNFFVYVRGQALGAETTTLHLIPWDMDGAFQLENSAAGAPHWREPSPRCPRRHLASLVASCDPILAALAEDEAGYRAAVEAVLAGPFAEGVLEAAIDRHVERLRDAIAADPFGPSVAHWEASVQRLRDDLPALRERVSRLVAGSLERVTLATDRVNDFSRYDALEVRTGMFTAVAQGGTARATLSPPDSELTGVRLEFVVPRASENWAYSMLPLEEPDSDVRAFEGLRLKARGRDVERVQVLLHGAEMESTGPRYSFWIDVSETAATYELPFADAVWSGGGDAPALDSVLQRLESLGISVYTGERAANGFVEIDDVEFY
ncbi:MAG: CotH kinase family protein [Pseudomonadota bacterium]